MKTPHYNGILKFAAALMSIIMVLFLSVSFLHAGDTDLEVWNSIINSQSEEGVCSDGSACEPSKEELKVLQNKNLNENKGALEKQEPLVKTPVKTKKEPVQTKTKIEIDSLNDLKPEKKQKTFHLKLALSVLVGLSIGFIYRKRRKK